MRPKILVSDDDATILRLLHAALEAAGYEVFTASTIQQTLRLSRSLLRLDLVILDRRLPDGDGLDALKVIRQNDPSIPCIFITGEADACHVAEIVNGGAEFVFRKPLDLRSLLVTIEEIVPSTVVIEPA